MANNQNQKPEYVEFFLDHLATDPAQYKPYSPSFTPVNAVIVRLPLDSALIEEFDPDDPEGVIVVGPEGLQAIVGCIADAIEHMHNERTSSRQMTRRPY